MIHRIELIIKPDISDPLGTKLFHELKSLQIYDIQQVRTLSAFIFRDVELTTETVEELSKGTLEDPILHSSRVNRFFGDELDFDWYIEVGFRPGVTDNVGRTAQETFDAWLQNSVTQGEHVHSSKGYFLKGNLSFDEVQEFTQQLLMNDLIESAIIISNSEWEAQKETLRKIPMVKLDSKIEVETFKFQSTDDLLELSRHRTLALNEKEAEVIIDYFSQPHVQQQRLAAGCSAEPTDVELEVLAQTWSEHCKHKIFSANVHYTDSTTGKIDKITSLYKTYVQGSTAKIREALGDKDWCVSVFSDNAGIIRFNKDWNVAMKVETHNSPSALDPYGGALTGIVGVNRDIMGVGLGAEMIFNTNVFCFASPFYDQPLPPKLMHPKRIFEGVRLGVEHGGNKSGVPTINGSIVFHERFLGKPLVFCGTGGLIPVKINEKPSHLKEIVPGDAIVMVGGRIGKDGIHGATFSSEALHEESPATAVQIGDPIVQRRMYDFLLEARDQGLYRCITDNGAGGLSSSVGEMAELSNGCHLKLEKAPLKYPGLQPWEIFISEAQERMTVAIPPKNVDSFLQLSQMMNVESTILGEFNDSGYLKATYDDKIVALLDMKFLHDGLPPMELNAVWAPPTLQEPNFDQPNDLTKVLHELLGRLNICSKERVIRQYDHEVQGGSVIKPLVGAENDGPSDAAVVRPVLESFEGLAVANGISARYSDIDTFHMMACAIDEATRNIIAVGGNLEQIAGLDNFCWCDPIESDSNPDGAYKMAQLVRSLQSLYDLTTLYGIPCISGKDSMKNDYRFGDTHIAILPTVLFTTVGKIKDIRKTITMDAKAPGDLVYILGETKDELGGSEYYDHLGYLGKNVPQVDGVTAKERYFKMSDAVEKQLIRSCHDCSDGGVAVALAETAFAGGLGMDLDVTSPLERNLLRADKFLFSESQSRFVVTISSRNRETFEALLGNHACYLIGQVTQTPDLIIKYKNQSIINASISTLKESWQATLR